MGTKESRFIVKKKEIMIACICVIAALAIAGCYNIFSKKKADTTDAAGSKVSIAGNEYKNYIAEKATVISDVEYGTAQNDKGQQESLKLDVYSPDENTYTENAQEFASHKQRPAIVMIHGGGLTGGDKANSGILKSMANDYARMGYVVFNINYRLGETASSTALEYAMKDAATAFTWIQSQSEVYGIDKDMIFLAGSSSGAVISVDLVYSNLSAFQINRDSIAGVIDISGLRLQVGSAKEGNPDCLIVHGTKDATDPYSESEALKAALDQANVSCELYTLDGMGHDVSIKYNEIRNKIASFMYQKLSGNEVKIEIASNGDPEFEKVMQRMEKSKNYTVKQLDVTVDGDLDEWKDCEVIPLNQLKDAGKTIPAQDDFSGNAMIAWNKKTPTIIYVAATVTDDTIASENGKDGKWYNNDCFEIAFDLSGDNVTEQLAKWCIGADGKALNVLADASNTTAAVKRDGNTSTYEFAIDLSKIDASVLNNFDRTTLSEEKSVGFSIAYDDTDETARKTQIGWIAGKMSDRLAMGTLYFE